MRILPSLSPSHWRSALGAAKRQLLIALALSAAGLVGIVSREGYTDRAVIPTKGDVPTIGFGTTEGVKLGDKTTPVPALQRALQDAQRFEGALKRCVKVPLHQYEYDAYVKFAYNIGATRFCSSTVVKVLNEERYEEACDHILDYKMFQGFDCSTPGNKLCGGLWSDRLKTRAECLGQGVAP